MIKATVTRTLLSAAIVTAAFSMPGPAMAQYHQGDDPLYHYYYSNAAQTETVGEAEDRCSIYGVTRHQLWGTTGPNVHSEIWAWCRNGQLSLE